MKVMFLKAFVLGFFFILFLSISPLKSQEAVDYEKILGKWDIEIDAEGEYYYLTLNLEKTNGELQGTISESSGFFMDVPLSEIEFDGTTLSFEFTAPTPPDGAERVLRAEFKVSDDMLEGTITIDDLGMTLVATGKREVN